MEVGDLFVGLMFVEFIEKDQFVFGVTDDGDKFSGLWVYKSSRRVVTGIFEEYDDKGFIGRRVYDCSNNIMVGEWTFRDKLKIVRGNGSVLFWNGNLPFAYTQKPESVSLYGEKYAPKKLVDAVLGSRIDSFDSVGIVVGDQAVMKLFGLENIDIDKFLDDVVRKRRISDMSKEFFEKRIFEDYSIVKPNGYNMTLIERLSEGFDAICDIGEM